MWGLGPMIAKGDPDTLLEARKGEKCICPEWPEDCSWLECRSDCRACKRRSAS